MQFPHQPRLVFDLRKVLRDRGDSWTQIAIKRRREKPD